MKLLKLPFWDYFKENETYPQYFETNDYWVAVFVHFLSLAAVIFFIWLIYQSVYYYFDKRSSTKEILFSELIDKRYTGEQSSSGIGTGITANGQVALVSTSSHSDEEFLFFVKADKVYKIEVDMQQFYGKNIGEKVKFELTIGGLSKEELNIEFLA